MNENHYRLRGLGAFGSGAACQFTPSIVFGTPFLWCLLGAVRGPLWWGSHRLLGDGIGRDSMLAWAMVAALGALWLGVRPKIACSERSGAQHIAPAGLRHRASPGLAWRMYSFVSRANFRYPSMS